MRTTAAFTTIMTAGSPTTKLLPQALNRLEIASTVLVVAETTLCQGNVYVTGSVYAASDLHLKQNITALDRAHFPNSTNCAGFPLNGTIIRT